MYHTQSKIMRPKREQNNITHNKQKKSIKSNAELTWMLKLPIKDIKSVFHIFTHLKWDMKDIKKNPNQISREEKYTGWDRIE